MNIQRYTPTTLYRNTCVIACQVSLAVLLSACGGGNEQSAQAPTDASVGTTADATGTVSISAAELADGNTTTLSVAQATSAGLVPTETQSASSTDDLTNTDNTDAPAIGAAQAEQPTLTKPNLDPYYSPSAVVEPRPESIAQTEPEAEAEAEVASVSPAQPEPAQQAQPEPALAAAEQEPDAPSAAEPPAQVEAEPEPAPAAPSEATASGQKKFVSNNTPGFEGEVLADGVVKVTWQKDPTARGYNFYRAGEYVTTVFGEEYLDKDTFDESYYYEVQAFDYDENYKYIALGLTVEVTGTGRINPDSPKPKENILDGYVGR